MHLNKRGQASSWMTGNLATIILGVIVFVVILLLLGGILLKTGVIASELVCKTSVAISSRIWIFQKLNFDTILCFTDSVKSDAESKEEVLEDIAEHMRRCWNMWGEGKLNPVGKNLVWIGESECFTCYKMSFPDFDDKEKISLDDTLKYLWEEVDMKDKLKGEETYWEYFKQSNPSNYINVVFPKEEDIINKNEFYAVTYFERINPSVVGNILSWSAIGATAGGVGCFFGGPAATVCAVIGGVGGGFFAISKEVVGNVVNGIMGRSPADGIQFMKYENAKENCVTVERGKSVDFDEKEFL